MAFVQICLTQQYKLSSKSESIGIHAHDLRLTLDSEEDVFVGNAIATFATLGGG